MRLRGSAQHYAWGSTTLIPQLLGVPATGEPWAEMWWGTHPGGPTATEDGSTLTALVDARPGVVGATSTDQFGPGLPYLLKLLGVAMPLSLQAHPDRTQAEAGWAREEAEGPDRTAPTRNYRDDWPKPEMTVALTDFEGLCGFADPDRTAACWRRLEVPALDELAAVLTGPDGLRLVLERVLTEPRWREVVEEVVTAAAPHVEREGDLGELARTTAGIARHHPGDPGLLVALTMNRVRLAPGEAIYLAPGVLHAHLSGLGVEVMASSDNVLRGGLTGKHVDVAELVAVAAFAPGEPALVPTVDEGEGRMRFDTPAPEFALWRVECSDTPTTVPATTTGRIVLATAGRVLLRTGSGSITLHRGEAAFLPAGEQVAANGAGTAFVAAPGVR